jgi:hypothetical protein
MGREEQNASKVDKETQLPKENIKGAHAGLNRLPKRYQPPCTKTARERSSP